MDIKNGLVAIAGEVLSDVQKEAEAIILEAEEKAKTVLQTSKMQADQIYHSLVNDAKVKSEAERRRIASLTEVEIRNRLLQTKEELFDAAFERAQVKLKDFVKTEQYNDYLLKLIEKTAKKINSKELLIQVNAKDKAWLTQDNLTGLSKKLLIGLNISDQTQDCIGGCRIQTEDGKVAIDSTIDNQLQELKPTLRIEVAKILFEEAT